MGNIIKRILVTFFRVLPLRNDIILESHPDFSDNAWAFYQYLLSRGFLERHRIYWALHYRGQEIPGLPENVDTFYLNAGNFRDLWKRLRVLYGTRYLFDSNSYIKKRRKGQVRVHLGHGMLIKVTPDYHNAEEIGELDGYLVTGDFWKQVLPDKIGIGRDKLLALGYPREDVLVSHAPDGLPAPETGDKRFIFWLPTYRQHKKHVEDGLTPRFPYGMPAVRTREELLALDDAVGEAGMTLYFRPHPVQELTLIKQEKLEHIKIADDDFLRGQGATLYECMAEADAVITDYSSVYYDFLLTTRPIGLTMVDREEYFQKYNCVFDDVTQYIKGCYIESVDELLKFIDTVAAGKNPWQPELVEQRELFHDYVDGNASERLYEYMRENWDFDKED